jgi:putative sterol carrier protein
MLDNKVLARIFLHAVLPCLEIITRADNKAQSIAGNFTGSISFITGFSGPRATLTFDDACLTFLPWKINKPDIVLFFANEKILNKAFSGAGVAFPLPVKGITRIRGILALMKLLKYMEDILQKREGNKDLKARSTLQIMARAMEIMANHERESQELAQHMKGVVEIAIKNLDCTQINFSGKKVISTGGISTSPDFILEFSTSDVFLGVVDDTVDVMAAACLGEIALKGNLHMGQNVNILFDKIGQYLQ